MPRRGPFRCAGTAFVDTDDAAISLAQEDENYIHFGLQVAVVEDISGNDVPVLGVRSRLFLDIDPPIYTTYIYDAESETTPDPPMKPNTGWLDGLGPNHQNHPANSSYINKLREDLGDFFDIDNPTAENVDDLKDELQRIAAKLVNDEYPWP